MDIDWRFVGAAIVILVIVGSAILAGQNMSGFSLFGASGPTKNITISSSLTMSKIDFNAPAEILTIEAYSQENSIFLGSQKIDLDSYTIIEFQGFQGQVATDKGFVSLNAQADTISVNDVPISNKDGKISFSAENLEFYLILAQEIILPYTRYENAIGYAYINDDKFYVQLDEEPLELGAFRGSLEISDSDVLLEGIVDRVLVDGESKFSVDE